VTVPKLIKTEEAYEATLSEIESLWGAQPGSDHGDRLELLTLLAEVYEQEHHPVELPSPVDAILFRMEQLGLSRADLGRVLGSRSRATEILNHKRRLSLPMIRRLHKRLGIPAEVLIRDHEDQNTSESPQIEAPGA